LLQAQRGCLCSREYTSSIRNMVRHSNQDISSGKRAGEIGEDEQLLVVLPFF
jgi:ribosome recycling factor